MKSIFVGLFAALCTPACSSTGAGTAPAPVPVTVIGAGPAEGVGPSLDAVGVEYLPAFEALQAALQAHENDTAEQILVRILARRPQGSTLRLAQAFGRVLTGRALVGGVGLALEGEHRAREEGEGTELWLELVVTNRTAVDVVFAPGPATLRTLVTAVAPTGGDQRASSSRTTRPLGRMAVAAGESSRIGLGSVPGAPIAGALAVCTRWSLVLRSGSIDCNGASYPAMNLVVEPHEETRLAPFLPVAAVEPAELSSYLERRKIKMPPLMERAVRIEAGRREEALDLITPVVLKLSPAETELVVPALRWLTMSGRLGGDPRSWKRWLAARRDARDVGTSSDDPQSRASASMPGLELPGSPRRGSKELLDGLTHAAR